MKKQNSTNPLLMITLAGIFLLNTFTGCSGRTNLETYFPGSKKTYAAGGVSFAMVYVPGKSLFTGADDSGTATVKNSFWISETEVTYELWKTVWTWAVNNRGYNFANPGIMGSTGTGSDQQPATTLNWRDAMVWGNAVTEWLNAHTSMHYTCVYKAGKDPVRDARGNNGIQCDSVIPDTAATGFRLPEKDEWELAARFRMDNNNDGDIMDTDEYYPGNHASGALRSFEDTAATALVAVFHTDRTAPVKSKTGNALGLYDMSGNMDEWCFSLYPGYKETVRLTRGGSWITSADSQQLGLMIQHDPHCEYFLIGFRLARSE